MKPKPTQIQRQEVCITRMSESRTSEKRSVKNRNAAIAEFRKKSLKLGYTEEEVALMVKDIRDMMTLIRNSE